MAPFIKNAWLENADPTETAWQNLLRNGNCDFLTIVTKLPAKCYLQDLRILYSEEEGRPIQPQSNASLCVILLIA